MAKSHPQQRIVYAEFGHAQPPEDATPADLPPQQQQVRIQASRSGRKGKVVTIITGLVLSGDRLKELLKQLKNQCGSGGTIKENILEIQGDHAQKLLQIMVDLGYKAKISGGK